MIFNLFKSKPTLIELIPQGFVDIHSHILPGVDDGAKNIKESIELIFGMKKLGFSKIIATPHTYSGLYENDISSISKSYNDLMKKIDATHPQYGFKNHKGYGTQEHLYALTLYGPCVHHRKSFGPVEKCGIGFLPTQEKMSKTNIAKRFMADMTDQEIKIELSKIEKTQGKKYAEELREIIRAEWLYVNQASSLRGK